MRDEGGDSLNLLFLVSPAVLLFGLARSFRPGSPQRPVFAYMTFTGLWVALCVNLIECGENDRRRFETDPLSIILLACAVGSLLAALRRRWRQRLAPHLAGP